MSDSAFQAICGVWQCDNSRSERFEDFLAEMGVGFLIRKMASKSSPTMHIEIKDGQLIVRTETGFKTKISSLPIDGTEKKEEEMGGGFVMAHLEVEDGKVIVVSKPVDNKVKPVKVTREIVNGELIQHLYVGSVDCKRVFKEKQ